MAAGTNARANKITLVVDSFPGTRYGGLFFFGGIKINYLVSDACSDWPGDAFFDCC